MSPRRVVEDVSTVVCLLYFPWHSEIGNMIDKMHKLLFTICRMVDNTS